MLIGVPKEIKNHEYRVGLSPASVRELVHHGHDVMVETQAGTAIGFSDELYKEAGASLAGDAKTIFAKAEMIVKVKEPQPVEYQQLSKGQLLFTYLHLAPDPDQTHGLLKSGCTAIAYETVTDRNGGLPLLAPMSEVAGRMSVQAGAHCLEKSVGGSGVLLSGVPGVAPGKVLVIGGGVAGTNAAKMAVGLGANVTILERSLPRLRQLDDQFQGSVNLLYSTQDALLKHLPDTDLVIGAVLIPGAAAPKLITKEMLKTMKSGSVLVDIAIDQGGCFETSHATTHADPVFIVDDIVHYCVANMPGAVAQTSTLALNNATLMHSIALANKGWEQAIKDDPHLKEGLNIHDGQVTCKAVADALDLPYMSADNIS